MQIVVQLISGGLRIKIFCHVQIFVCKLMQSIASNVYFLWSFLLKISNTVESSFVSFEEDILELQNESTWKEVLKLRSIEGSSSVYDVYMSGQKICASCSLVGVLVMDIKGFCIAMSRTSFCYH